MKKGNELGKSCQEEKQVEEELELVEENHRQKCQNGIFLVVDSVGKGKDVVGLTR